MTNHRTPRAAELDLLVDLTLQEARSLGGGTLLPTSTLLLLADLAISYETMKAQQAQLQAAASAV